MKKILIVDDEDKVRRLIKVTLAIGDFEILEASTGEEALKIAREVIPDIILLDIMMPGDLDGYDVCRSIKKDPVTKEIYVIMLTAKGQKADIEKGKAVCANDYFIKPFSPMELIKKIDNIL
ncbi:MAG: response regulator [Deltaproteobacteria bacterium]|nr:MAG: response regulator [Deltaproteobacteria bacterium]